MSEWVAETDKHRETKRSRERELERGRKNELWGKQMTLSICIWT